MGLATTGPAGGLLAIAGAAGGGATIFACCRGCGTILRGPGVAGGAAGCAGALAAETAETVGTVEGFGCTGAGTVAGGATTAGRVMTGGAAFAAASACLRSRIAFSASPGLDTFDRSNFGLDSADDLDAPVAVRPPLR